MTLSGTVEWNYQRRAAKRAVKNLAGMTWVSNKIVVAPQVKTENIKAKISQAFERSAQVDAQKIRVEVEGTKVILSGTVRSWAEKAAASRAARAAPGVS